MQDLFYYPSVVEHERRLRIRLSVFAYAYEFEAVSLVSDAYFDNYALKINPNISTGRDDLDLFFRTQFDPCTGMWIHSHPELDGIKRLYRDNYL